MTDIDGLDGENRAQGKGNELVNAQAYIGLWGKAINRLREENPLHLDELSEPNEPQVYIVEENATLERFLEYKRLDMKVRLFWEGGNVLIYELRISTVHERIGAWIVSRMNQISDHITDNGGASVLIGNPINLVYEPDRTIIPLHRPNPVIPPTPQSTVSGRPFPTLVIDIGVTQTLASLHHKATHYLVNSTDIQMVLCIKLFPKYNNNNFDPTQPVQGNNTPQTYCAVALFYKRGFSQVVPERVISFGTRPLPTHTVGHIVGWGVENARITGYRVGADPAHAFINAPGNPTHILQIPTVDIFHGASGGVPAEVPANIDLDLFTLRNTIIDTVGSFND